MAFKLHTVASPKTEVLEEALMTDSEACTIGEALVQSSGRLTACGATATPEFIAMASKVAGTSVVVPVKRVYEDEVYETTMYGNGSSAVIGTKLTLHTTALQVTPTTSSGVAYLVEKVGTGADGTAVRVMFRR